MGTSLSSLVPDLEPFARQLVRIAGANGLQPRITSARRTVEEQRQLYSRYLRGLNPYPVAPPGTSAHETGEAFDMLVTPVEYLPDLGEIWTQWGGQWGGNNDPVHFQLPGAPTLSLLVDTKGSQANSVGQTIGEWILKTYNEIPWWLSLVLPASVTVNSADKPATRRLIQRILGY